MLNRGAICEENMTTKDQTISILFSDLKGYSALKSDDLKYRLVQIIKDEVENHLLTAENSFYHNTWGDAYLICSNDPADLAEIALKMRDFVKTRDWPRLGFSDPVSIRVGVHTQKAKIVFGSNGRVENVIGVGIDTTARIEPVTEPNRVFCSNIFYQHILQDTSNIKGIHIGERPLAKRYGMMNLYELVWSHEIPKASAPPVESTPIPMPAVLGKVTDKNRADYLRYAYEQINAYFKRAVVDLKAQHPQVDAAIKDITPEKFVCELYIDGNLKGKCKIWLMTGAFMNNSIGYFEGNNIDVNADNHTNELISVENDENELYLKRMEGLASMYGAEFIKGQPIQIAESFWTRFGRVLR